MTLLHTMTLAGSIAVVIYMLIYPLTKRWFPMLWHKTYLTVAALLFIIPFQYIGIDYRTWLGRLFGEGFPNRGHEGRIDVGGRTIFIYNNAVYLQNPWLYIAVAACLVLSIWLLVGMLRRYRGVRFGIMEDTCRDEQAEAVLRAYGKSLGINTDAAVYRGKYLQTPVTVGILHQRIILPDMEWTQESLESVFHHELTHIRYRDNFVKLVVLLAVILNFYNSLVYYLRYRWNLATEMYCDDKVILGKSQEQMADYANVIISLAEERESCGLPILGLNSGKRALKERIERIGMMKKTGKRYGRISTVLGSIVTLAAVFASSLTVFAYEPEQMNNLNKDAAYNGEEIAFFFNEEDGVAFSAEETLFKKYEAHLEAEDASIFIDEAENVYYDVDTVEPHAICTHNYVSGTFTQHSKYTDGSCKVDYYSGQRCNKCGHCIYGDHISTTTYDVCPH